MSVSHDSCSFAGDNHETCNLGNNPGHAVVTRKGNSYISYITKILTTMSDNYGSNQKDWTKFQLFNSTKYGYGYNLLFKDSTTELKEIPSSKQNYNDYLGKDYGENREAMASCIGGRTTTSGGLKTTTAGLKTTTEATTASTPSTVFSSSAISITSSMIGETAALFHGVLFLLFNFLLKEFQTF